MVYSHMEHSMVIDDSAIKKYIIQNTTYDRFNVSVAYSKIESQQQRQCKRNICTESAYNYTESIAQWARFSVIITLIPSTRTQVILFCTLPSNDHQKFHLNHCKFSITIWNWFWNKSDSIPISFLSDKINEFVRLNTWSTWKDKKIQATLRLSAFFIEIEYFFLQILIENCRSYAYFIWNKRNVIENEVENEREKWAARLFISNTQSQKKRGKTKQNA